MVEGVYREEEVHLLDYLEVMVRRKWIIIATLLCVLTVVVLGTFLIQPIYQAGARLKIGKEERVSPRLGRGEYWESEYSESLTYQTHSQMITSLPVLYEAAKRLKLEELKEKERKPTFKEEVRRNIGKIKAFFLFPLSLISPGEAKKEFPYPEDPYISWANALKGEVTVSPLRNTRLIEVRVQDVDPVFCRDAADTICESYISYLTKSRLDSFRGYLSFFSDELAKMKEKLEESENKFYEFKQREGIFSLEGKKEISTKDISSLSTDLIRTRVERNGLEERVKELEGILKKGKIEDFSPAILDNQILFQLKSDLIRVKIEVEGLKKTYREKHPLVMENRTKIEKIEESFNRELGRAVAGLKQEISILKGKEERIASQGKGKEGEDLVLSGKELRYAILEREVETNRQLYGALLSNFKEMDILKGLGEEEVKLVDRAQIPSSPVKPRPMMNLFLALVTGLALGVGLSFFLEYMDRSIKDERDVDRYLGLPVLSLIPREKESPVKTDRREEGAEFFRSLAINLRFQALDRPGERLLITSPGVGEGKTTIVRNLGVTLAKSGSRVLIIDADLRKSPSGSVSLPGGGGLTELLRKFPSLEPKGWLNEGFSFGDLQRIIFAEGRSGTINIYKGERQFLALFDRGKLIDLSWQDRPLERKLGQLLLRTKAISEGTLNDALTMSESAGKRVGSVLLSLDVVSPERIEKLLDLHFSETLSLLLSPEIGRYEFMEGGVAGEGMVLASMRERSQLKLDAPYLEKIVSTYLVLSTETENLLFLPAGPVVPNPLPLISSRMFEVIIMLLKEGFDYILLDAPPLFLAETTVLTQYSDSALLVLMAGSTRPEAAKKAMDILKGTGVNISGVILNGVDLKRDRYYDYYRYYGKREDEGPAGT